MTNKPLSARERAARILHETGCKCEAVKYCDCVNLIASEIEEAEREARLKERQKLPCCCDETRECDCYSSGYKEGFKSGAEAAARVAEIWPGPGGIIYIDGDLRDPAALFNGLRPGIAKAIRALPSATVPGEGKE